MDSGQQAYGLAPHLRKEPLLSKIASAIGNLIKTDGFTSSGDKLMYARVLIEVYASLEFKKSVTIQGPRGVNFVQKIHYEWLPPRCSHCQRFGHSVAQCSIPRIRVEEDEKEDERMIIEPEGRSEEEKFKDVPLEHHHHIIIISSSSYHRHHIIINSSSYQHHHIIIISYHHIIILISNHIILSSSS
ncbi:hypothetical protein QQ045_020547 [Rhodiola kirilowii]